MAQPEAEVITLLDSVTGLVKATRSDPPFDGNLIAGVAWEDAEGIPDMDVGCVFVELAGSMGYDLLVGSSSADRKEIVRVVVRGIPQDYAGSLSLARSCLAACVAKPTGYYCSVPMTSQPIYEGSDAYQRHSWRFDVLLSRVA